MFNFQQHLVVVGGWRSSWLLKGFVICLLMANVSMGIQKPSLQTWRSTKTTCLIWIDYNNCTNKEQNRQTMKEIHSLFTSYLVLQLKT